MPLTAIQIAKIAKPGRYSDGRNLYLQITERKNGSDGPAVTKSWLFRYRLHGKSRMMGLGPVDLVSLADARERAYEARRLLLKGVDPIEARNGERDAARLKAAGVLTFEQAAERFLAAHEAGWRNAKHRQQWRSTLSTYVYPEIGQLPVSSIDTALVLRILEPIWRTKTETAGRVRGRIESVLDWAAARGYRQGDNPARWRGHIEQLLPARATIAPTEHHPAMPYKAVPAFLTALRRHQGISALALEWTVLTASRTGEVIGARWAEIDQEQAVWTVPAERMKGRAGKRREHRVPLSKRALALLAEMPRVEGCEFLFPGVRPGTSISNMAMLELLKGMRPGLTVHGFRSSFKDWATEQTDHARDIVEAALAHINGDKVELAYRRGDAIEKRRRLMADWEMFCMQHVPCVAGVDRVSA